MRRLILMSAFVLSLPAVAMAADEDARAALSGRLVAAAADIRGVERQLERLQENLADLNLKKANLEKEYRDRRARMAGTLAALTHMAQTPREAVLIRPGGPLQAARTSMLLSASLPAIETQAASFRGLLTELEKTRGELARKTTQAETARADLSARHRSLSALLENRDASHDIAAESAAVAALVRDAQSLKDLLEDLSSGGPKMELQAVSVPEGEGQLPVSGVVRVRYGQRDPDTGNRASGLSIETLSGAVVVAPLGGVVRYAGPFKGYGTIVIIAHKGGYYSLIAGLDKLSVSAGQEIVSGEPVAILGTVDQTNQAGNARRSVYYELRYGGQPIDPSRKLPDLG